MCNEKQHQILFKINNKMENLDFGGKYSSKNIPLPSKKEYKKQQIYAVKEFINNLRWRVFFHKMKIKSETDKENKNH